MQYVHPDPPPDHNGTPDRTDRIIWRATAALAIALDILSVVVLAVSDTWLGRAVALTALAAASAMLWWLWRNRPGRRSL